MNAIESYALVSNRSRLFPESRRIYHSLSDVIRRIESQNSSHAEQARDNLLVKVLHSFGAAVVSFIC